MMVQIAERILKILPPEGGRLPDGVTCGRLLALVEEVLGDNMKRFPDGRMLIWDIARHDGYNIPEYPMAGCGDVKEFLEDEGARNVPCWYERHLGMSRGDYDEIWRFELVMVMNRSYWRRVFQIPSTLTTMRSENGGAFLEAMRTWLSYAVGAENFESEPYAFKR